MNTFETEFFSTFGWAEHFQQAYEISPFQGRPVGRVIAEHKQMYRVSTEHGEVWGEVSGKFRHQSSVREDFPAVGDWVVLDIYEPDRRGTIHEVLPRFSKFSRTVAGKTGGEQIIATNVNTVFLVSAVNQDFNVRRLERYLVTAWDSGARPVVVLTKADLCMAVEELVATVESVAFGVPVVVTSAVENSGFSDLQTYLGVGQTVALLGSSGVGKSTIINHLLRKEVQLVQEVRTGDDRGRHTTTHREIIPLPGGCLLMDTPGMRELQLWESDQGLDSVFEDIDRLSEQCRFRDCLHGSEPGCAVRAAIEDGRLDEERWHSFRKLERELAFQERKQARKAKPGQGGNKK